MSSGVLGCDAVSLDEVFVEYAGCHRATEYQHFTSFFTRHLVLTEYVNCAHSNQLQFMHVIWFCFPDDGPLGTATCSGCLCSNAVQIFGTEHCSFVGRVF